MLRSIELILVWVILFLFFIFEEYSSIFFGLGGISCVVQLPMATIPDIPSTCATASDHVATPAWLEQGGFIPVLLGVATLFWSISFVCEEFGVPSLAAFCKRNRLSDALTGSIFIGTGLSLPVFFIAVAGLFASNSAIGVGAVVGGNLFNHLFTIATSIYISPNRVMKLDGAVFTREMLIYFLTCLLVLWTVADGDLSHAFNHALDKNQWNECLSISWPYSLALVVSYIAYCILDGYFYLIEHFVQRWWYGSVPATSVLIPTSDQFASPDNFNTVSTVKQEEVASSQHSTETATNNILSPSDSIATESLTSSSPTVPIQNHSDVELGNLCSSSSSSSTPSSSNSIDNNSKVSSVSDMDAALISMQDDLVVEEIKAKTMMDSAFDQGDRYVHILTLEADANPLQQGFFYLTFPLRFAIYLTIPDVRRPGSETHAIRSMLVTVVWLALLSYVLTLALTLLANWWQMSSAVMGITVAAWASNFPAHWSSIVVSKHGFGDVSCCNCLGSNTFNNLIGLGLPWLLYSIVYKGASYEALQDDGVCISVLLMMATIAVHYVVVWASNWVLREWMIAPMIILYIVEIAFLCYFYSAVV